MKSKFLINFSRLSITKSLHTTPKMMGLQDFFESNGSWIWKSQALPTGEIWEASLLKNKTFDDLHKLWWFCIKEQNKLYSQKEEARRFQLLFPHKERLLAVRKTMANIKLVLWERKILHDQSQYVLKKCGYELELEKSGLPKEEIEAKVQEKFPLPIESVGKRLKKVKPNYFAQAAKKKNEKRRAKMEQPRTFIV